MNTTYRNRTFNQNPYGQKSFTSNNSTTPQQKPLFTQKNDDVSFSGISPKMRNPVVAAASAALTLCFCCNARIIGSKIQETAVRASSNSVVNFFTRQFSEKDLSEAAEVAGGYVKAANEAGVDHVPEGDAKIAYLYTIRSNVPESSTCRAGHYLDDNTQQITTTVTCFRNNGNEVHFLNIDDFWVNVNN